MSSKTYSTETSDVSSGGRPPNDPVRAFAAVLAEAEPNQRDAMISRARMVAMNGADHDRMPVLLSRDEWNVEHSGRLATVRDLIEASGYGDQASRLLDRDENATTARAALERRIADELTVTGEHAARLLTAALGVSARKVGRTAAELLTEVPEETDWLIPGLIARGWAVKIAAREKVGKGTLVAYLLARLEQGRETVFGAAAEPVSALIYTEEPQESVREKVANFGLSRAGIIYGWELAAVGLTDWPERAAFLAQKAAEDGHGIVFADNISRAAGVEDEAGVELARAAEVLIEACRSLGLTTIIDHHHKKGGAALADKSRGGTALAGAVDNNIELEVSGGFLSRYRKVSSMGRLSATRWQRLIVLDDDGRGYSTVADDDEPQDTVGRVRLRKLYAFGDDGATVKQYMEEIEVGEDRARQLLKEYVDAGQATCDDGRPARYTATGKRARNASAELDF